MAVYFGFLNVLKRQFRFIVLLTLVVAAISSIGVMRMKETFSATSTVLLDQRGTRPLETNSPAPLSPDGEVELMKSESVALRVVERLKLAEQPEFVPEPGRISKMLGTIRAYFPQSEEQNPVENTIEPSAATGFKPVSDRTATALRNLTSNILIRRRGLSDIIAIQATSTDRRLAAQIANAYAQAYLDEQVAPKIQSVERAEEVLNRQIEELNAELKRSESNISLRQVYQATQARLKAVNQQRDLIGPDSRIASLARAPGGGGLIPVKVFGLIGALCASFCVAFGIAYVRDMHTRRLQTEEEIERLSHVPNLGSIPYVRAQKRHRGEILADHVVTRPSGPYGVAVRRLLFALQATIKAGQRNGIVLVTSTQAGEGRTTLALALARTAAGAGCRVVIIDCNLRDPKLSRMLRLREEPGLVEFLEHPAEGRLFVHNDPVSTAMIVAAGDTTHSLPERLLTPERLRDVALRLRHEFDLVLLDAPPLNTSADSLILASIADTALYVVKAGGADPYAVQGNLGELRRGNDTEIMTVLTFKSV